MRFGIYAVLGCLKRGIYAPKRIYFISKLLQTYSNRMKCVSEQAEIQFVVKKYRLAAPAAG